MQKLKTQKGITLIVLVITIIIMLILATVSIGIAINGGLFGYAQKSSTEYQLSALKEEVGIILNERQINQPVNILSEDLQKIKNAHVEEVLKDMCYVTKNNVTVTAYENGVIEVGKVTIATWDGQTMEVPEITDNNWYINNSEQFYFLSNFVNEGLTEDMKEMVLEKGYDETAVSINSDTTISLTTNLYLENYSWTPIGKDLENSFMGKFEGNDYFISGANVSSDTELVGIFGYVTGEVNDLTIKDSLVEATGTNSAGGIVGYLADTGEINNCHNVNTEVKGNAVVGGVAGTAYGDVYKSTSSGTVTGNVSQTGGIVGAAYKNIEECENLGPVTALGNSVGGISGSLGPEGKILSCKNIGAVTINNTNSTNTSNTFIGGISGMVSGQIEKTSNYGTVLSQSYARWNRVGGLVGALGAKGVQSTIKECCNFADVTAIGFSTYMAVVGGFVGDSQETIIINDCYNSGNILGTNVSYSYVGGIVGRVQTKIIIENCYSKGKINENVSATTIVDGGIIGIMNSSYENVGNTYYYDALDNNIGAIAGKDSATYNAMEIENIFNNFDEFNEWLTTTNSNNG